MAQMIHMIRMVQIIWRALQRLRGTVGPLTKVGLLLARVPRDLKVESIVYIHVSLEALRTRVLLLALATFLDVATAASRATQRI